MAGATDVFLAGCLPQVASRSPNWTAIVALCAIYVIVGLTGHDPWKQDETYVTSIVNHISKTEDWIVPHSAGRPFLEKPPLYYLVAEEFSDALAPWLPLHDGARLSNL